jgi:hypothetical protein
MMESIFAHDVDIGLKACPMMNQVKVTAKRSLGFYLEDFKWRTVEFFQWKNFHKLLNPGII